MNSYIEYLRSRSGEEFGAFWTGPLASVTDIQNLAEQASKVEPGTSGFWSAVNAKIMNPKTAANIKTAEDLLNATSEERNRFEKIAMETVAKKKSSMSSEETKDVAEKKKLLKVLEEDAKPSNLIQSLLTVAAGAVVGGVGYHIIGKMQ